MKHALLIAPRGTRPSPLLRHLLLLALGLSILAGLAVSGAASGARPERQVFSEPPRSPSVMPETVRLRTTP